MFLYGEVYVVLPITTSVRDYSYVSWSLDEYGVHPIFFYHVGKTFYHIIIDTFDLYKY